MVMKRPGAPGSKTLTPGPLGQPSFSNPYKVKPVGRPVINRYGGPPNVVGPPSTTVRQSAGQREMTANAADGPIPILYGRQRLGGRIFYVNVAAGQLYVAMAFCEGPVHSLALADVTIDGELLSLCASKGWVASYNLHTGALNQAVDSLLSGAFGYTQTHPGLCYLVLKISGTAPWSGLPNVLAVIEGFELWDPRTSTTVYSRNPVIIARDMLARFGAQVTADFDDDSAHTAADYYDETIDSEPRYALDLAIISQSTLRQWLETVKAHCGLDVYMDQGVWCFSPDKTLSSPVALTNAHLADVRISRKRVEDTPNRIVVRWTNASKDYVSDTAVAETDTVAAGTEDPVEQSIDCSGITSLKTAQRHALYLLRRAVFSNLVITAKVSPMAEQLVRGSYVTITYRSFLTAQGAIVRSSSAVGDGSFDMSFEEYDANAYSTANVATDTPPASDLLKMSTVPNEIVNQVGSSPTRHETVTVIAANQVPKKVNYLGIKYALPTNVPREWLKRIVLRGFVDWTGTTDPATLGWTSPQMEANEVMVSVEGNVGEVSPGVFQLYHPAMGNSYEVAGFLPGGPPSVSDAVVRAKLMAKVETIFGVQSASGIAVSDPTTNVPSDPSDGTLTPDTLPIANQSNGVLGDSPIYVEGTKVAIGGTTSDFATFQVKRTVGAVGHSEFACIFQGAKNAAEGQEIYGVWASGYATNTSGTVGAAGGLNAEAGASASGGTVGEARSVTCIANVGSGATATKRFGVYVYDTNGAGSVGTQYGYYCAPLSKGTTNWAFYADGQTPSYFGGNVLVYATMTAGAARVGNNASGPTLDTWVASRTLPTTIGNYVEIGNFTLANGAGFIRVTVVVPSTSYSVSKSYVFPVAYNWTANVWQVAQPISDSGAFTGNDFALDFNISNQYLYLRLRSLTTTAGNAQVCLEHIGYGGVVFTPTTGTGTSTPTATKATGGQVPTGTILGFAGSAAPMGFLLCDGSSVSETTYAALFAVIGHTYGGDPGGGNFRVPDLRQKFPLGKAASGTGGTLGGTGGNIDHTHSLSAHTHNVDIAEFASSTPTGGGGIVGHGLVDTPTPIDHTHNVNPPLTATGPPDTDYTDGNNPPFLAINYIIKT